MTPSNLTKDELVAAAREDYISQGWVVSSNPTSAEATFWDQLSRRPEFVARQRGMEHLVFATGKVTDATYKLLTLLLYDLERAREFSHVVIICEGKVPGVHENKLKEMGLGVLQIRKPLATLMLVKPRLACFKEPENYDRVAHRIRRHVREAARKIREEDVCTGVLDLAQILEQELTRCGCTDDTLGRKIRQAIGMNLLSDLEAKAAFRVNAPRVKIAHPRNHRTRRNAIVSRVQEIFDDCLAVLFVLG